MRIPRALWPRSPGSCAESRSCGHSSTKCGACSQISRAELVSFGPNGCSRRRRPRKRLTDDQAVADRNPTPVRLAGRDLEHCLCTSASRNVPGPEIRGDLDDAQVAIEEYGVDRKAHERHVHRRRRLQQDALAARELAPAEQALHARERRVPEDTALTHDGSLFATNRDF